MNFMKKTFMDSLKLIEALNIIQAEEQDREVYNLVYKMIETYFDCEELEKNEIDI